MADFDRVAGHPRYAFGDGPRDLLVLPGLSDAFQSAGGSRLAAAALERYYYREYGDAFTVHVVGRPRGLAEGTTTREMAAGYADVLDALGGEADVLGVSMGGLIAQHLAADRPGLVGRLVLAVSAARLSDYGRDVVRDWRDRAAAGDWFDVYRASIPRTYLCWRRHAYSALVDAAGPRLLPAPADPSDVAVSAAACVDHDAREALADATAPTLLVGGELDPLFPPDRVRETADRLPDAEARVLRGVAHGAFEERKGDFDAAVLSFLTE